MGGYIYNFKLNEYFKMMPNRAKLFWSSRGQETQLFVQAKDDKITSILCCRVYPL